LQKRTVQIYEKNFLEKIFFAAHRSNPPKKIFLDFARRALKAERRISNF